MGFSLCCNPGLQQEGVKADMGGGGQTKCVCTVVGMSSKHLEKRGFSHHTFAWFYNWKASHLLVMLTMKQVAGCCILLHRIIFSNISKIIHYRAVLPPCNYNQLFKDAPSQYFNRQYYLTIISEYYISWKQHLKTKDISFFKFIPFPFRLILQNSKTGKQTTKNF